MGNRSSIQMFPEICSDLSTPLDLYPAVISRPVFYGQTPLQYVILGKHYC
jgi:hypothetical protein